MVSKFTIKFHIAAHSLRFIPFRPGAAFHTISILAAFSYIFNIAALFGCVLYPPLATPLTGQAIQAHHISHTSCLVKGM